MIVLIIKILEVLIAVMVISMIIDNRCFVVRTYRLRSSRIKKPVKLVFIADLHEKSYGKDNEKLVEKIKELAPDAVIVGGDLVVYGQVNRHYEKSLKSGQKNDGPGTDWMKHSLSLMKRLAQICPVFFAEGNHELRLEYYEELNAYDDKFREEMEKAGVRMLYNGAVELPEDSGSGILLQGLELPMKYYRKFRRTRLTEEELQPLVNSWRNSNPMITAFWWEIDRAVKTTITQRIQTEVRRIRFFYKSGILFIKLPSGRLLSYVKPRIGENQYGGESVTYEGVGSTKKWERIESYGPKFVENIVQAVSRDILCYAMKTLRHCFIVGHVHDELIIECSADVDLNVICKQMGRSPDWMPDILLRADGYETMFYKKD